MTHTAARRYNESTARHGIGPSTRTPGWSSPATSPHPGGPDHEQLEVGSRRAEALQRGDDRREVLAGLDGADGEQVRVAHAQMRERRVDLVIVPR